MPNLEYNQIISEFRRSLERYGKLLLIRHIYESSDYRDIIVNSLLDPVSNLIGTKRFSRIEGPGTETRQIYNFYILEEKIPSGFQIQVKDILIVIDQDLYREGKIEYINKYNISLISKQTVNGSRIFRILHCEFYTFNQQDQG